MVIFYTYILENIYSNLSRILTNSFCGLPQSILVNYGTVFWIGKDRLLPNSYPLSVHKYLSIYFSVVWKSVRYNQSIYHHQIIKQLGHFCSSPCPMNIIHYSGNQHSFRMQAHRLCLTELHLNSSYCSLFIGSFTCVRGEHNRKHYVT